LCDDDTRTKGSTRIYVYMCAYMHIDVYSIYTHIYIRERKSRRPDDWLYTNVQAHYLCSIYLSKLKKLLLYREKKRNEAKGYRKNPRHFTYIKQPYMYSCQLYEHIDSKHMSKRQITSW